jgi:hypothetical protein
MNSDLEQNAGRIAIFFRSRSFLLQNAISIYIYQADTGADVHGLSWLQNHLTDHILAFESEQRIPNAVELACGAIKFLLPSAAMCRSKNSKNQCSVCAFFACALCADLFLYVAQVNERKLVCVCSAVMSAL